AGSLRGDRLRRPRAPRRSGEAPRGRARPRCGHPEHGAADHKIAVSYRLSAISGNEDTAMATETKAGHPKITYATMTADRMEDLHRELDAAIARVKTTFGKSYPMMIGGQAVRGPSEFADRSPIDTRIL